MSFKRIPNRHSKVVHAMGDGVDLSSLLSSTASAAESAAVSSVSSNAQVQSAANQAAITQLATFIVTYEQEIIAGLGLLGILILYRAFR